MELLKALSVVLLLLTISMTCHGQDRYLSLPQLDKCNNRYKEAQYQNRNFFYSGNDPELKDVKLDWLDSRNKCRERCMETVSFETQEKFDFYKNYIEQKNISFVWTSGRLCDFAGCEGRWDLLPKRIKGWLWSANQVPIAPTNKIPPGWDYQPWSFTGIRKRPQPDNAEIYISQTSEACLGILNNMYNDSVAWHDIACYHRTRFICEDSEILLKEVLEPKEENSIEEEPVTTTRKPTTVRGLSKARDVKSTTTRRTASTTTTTENSLLLETTEDSDVNNNLLNRQSTESEASSTTEGLLEVESSTESENSVEVKASTEAETSTEAQSTTESESTTTAQPTTEAESSTESQAPATTKRSRLRGRQRETTVAAAISEEKSSSVQARRQRVSRRKPTTASTEERKINEDDRKDSETTEAALMTTTTEKEIVKGNETMNSTDDPQAEEKIEEVETSTAAEATSTTLKVVPTDRLGRRLRRPVPRPADE